MLLGLFKDASARNLVRHRPRKASATTGMRGRDEQSSYPKPGVKTVRVLALVPTSPSIPSNVWPELINSRILRLLCCGEAACVPCTRQTNATHRLLVETIPRFDPQGFPPLAQTALAGTEGQGTDADAAPSGVSIRAYLWAGQWSWAVSSIRVPVGATSWTRRHWMISETDLVRVGLCSTRASALWDAVIRLGQIQLLGCLDADADSSSQ